MTVFSNEELIEKLSIKIEKAVVYNSSIKGLCPFHIEKTPSFFVSLEKKFFKCFGCGVSGNLTSLVQQLFGIVPVRTRFADKDIRYTPRSNEELYFEVLERIHRLSLEQLLSTENKAAVEFLKTRSLSIEQALKFGIGIATHIEFRLHREGYTDKTLSTLPYFSFRNGRIYFELNGLLIFPIRNKDGRVAGFSGRSCFNKSYLNMRNNEYFSRGTQLFYLNIKELQDQSTVYIVEGYFDVISLAKKNIFAVATMGTQVSECQKSMLKELNKEMVLAFDSDLPGINAAVKLSNELHIEKLFYSETYKDVDEVISHGGQIDILNRIDYINLLLKRSDFSLELVTCMSKIEKLAFFKEFLTRHTIDETIDYFSIFDDFFASLRMQLIKEKDIVENETFNADICKDILSYTFIIGSSPSKSNTNIYNKELLQDIKLWAYYNIQIRILCLEEFLPHNLNEFMKCKLLFEKVKKDF